MNRDKIISLLEDEAHFNVRAEQLVHPSFRKGFRKLSSHNISWQAAVRALGARLVCTDGIYRIAAL